RTDAAGTTTFSYDNRGQLATLVDGLSGITGSYSYNDAGQLDHINYNTTTAIARTFSYDTRGRLSTDVTTNSTTTLASTTYGYAADSNITGGLTSGTASNSAYGRNYYGFDPTGRLASWTHPDTSVTNYTYDEAGNRTAAGGTTYTYDARNRLTQSD